MISSILVQEVGKLLLRSNTSISLAESVTGGMIMSKLTGFPGISKVFRGGIVCYDPSIKVDVLRVPEKLIEEYSCESQQISNAIAKGISVFIPADICIGITGLASSGASQSETKPVGSIYIAILMNDILMEKALVFRGSRNTIREEASKSTFLILRDILRGNQRVFHDKISNV